MLKLFAALSLTFKRST